MADVPYRFWSLIPSDTDPAHGRPGSPNPPRMSTLALDRSSSLVFDLGSARPKRVSITMTTTALSAEGRHESPAQVWAGETDEAMAAVEARWEAKQEGIHMEFTTSLSPVPRKVKLHLATGRPLVVVGVAFAA